MDLSELRKRIEDTPAVYGEGLDPETRVGVLALLDEVERLRAVEKAANTWIRTQHDNYKRTKSERNYEYYQAALELQIFIEKN